MKYTKDGCTTKVKVDKEGNVFINAVSGYNPDVGSLCQIEDNDNGYYIRFPSYSSVNPDHVFNLNYSELEYLYYAYKALKKKGIV